MNHSIKSILKTILRSNPASRGSSKVVFEDFSRTEPISRLFGFDRGTPIDRHYIDKFLLDNKKHIHGNVLEIAENTYSKKFGENVASYEILHYDDSNKRATIIGDLTNPSTLPEEKIDCFICTQTFNFIFDVQKAIDGCYRLLRKGGTLLATVSGISQISRYDMDRWGDYWRFTDLSIRKLMEAVFDKENIEIATYGNALTANAFLQGLAVEDLPDKKVLEIQDIDYQITIGICAIK
jgi:SAM-dependent methyltransferase